MRGLFAHQTFRQWAVLAGFAALALATRFTVFGDWHFDVDDQFFSLVGHRMLAGDILYVDIIDRKGPALFLAFAGFAALDASALGYQLAGTLATALAGFGLYRIGAAFEEPKGGIVAGILYCGYMVAFGGSGGQAAVFYNPLVIFAAWTIASGLDQITAGEFPRRLLAGFLAAGLAIAFKMSAVFEGLFFGLFVLGCWLRCGILMPVVALRGAVLATLGILPLALAGAWYLQAGYFDEFWTAVVDSNFQRTYFAADDRLARLGVLALLMVPFAILIAFALTRSEAARRLSAANVLAWGWAATAIAGLVAYPLFMAHYMMAAIAPLCVAGLRGLGDWRIGGPAALFFCVMVLMSTGEIDPSARAVSKAQSARMIAYLEGRSSAAPMLVWGQPSHLYTALDKPPPAPLAFHAHLTSRDEQASFGIDEAAQIRALLKRNPEPVIYQTPLPSHPLNTATTALVDAYVAQCRTSRDFQLTDHKGMQTYRIFTDCRPDGRVYERQRND